MPALSEVTTSSLSEFIKKNGDVLQKGSYIIAGLAVWKYVIALTDISSKDKD